MLIEKQATLEKHIKGQGINLFLGAGFSYHAYNKADRRLPLGEELKKLLIEEFELEKFKDFSLSQISNVIKKSQKADFHRFLIENYTVHDYEEKYDVLDLINIRNIFTLNIDDLVERIYTGKDKNNVLYDVSVYGSVENEGINFHKLHGSITYPNDKELLFTPEELSILLTTEPAKFHHAALKISSLPTVFWGTQLEDANVLALLSKKTTRDIQPKGKWIVLTPEPENDAQADYFSVEGFNVIRGYTEDVLNYFKRICSDSEEFIRNTDGSQISSSIIRKYFSKNYLSCILQEKHPVRPLKTFFSGDDPVWSDVIDNKIIKLSCFNDCLAKIDKYKSLLITGGVGCGKSTLLMQLAVESDVQGHKFYFDSIDSPTARKLIDFCDQQADRVHIFLDNLANNLDAYKLLVENPKVHFICGERDIVFDSIKHLTKFSDSNKIIDVTELDKVDIQALCDLARNTTFKAQKNTPTSLFELAYFVWEGKKLESKIHEVIIFLSNKKENHLLLEFFTLMVYVRSCGISASMDMLLLYYADDDVSYNDIYTFVTVLSSMIDDEEHYTIRKEQDFYTLRSKLFSEIALNHLPPDVIAKVLMKFTENVHKDCIVKYNSFKRKAYDADIARKAFVLIEDGINFYEKVTSMDHSEYRYQQYALYLFRKGRLKESWDIIEIAHGINPKNMTIKNTHAYILFKMNINVDSVEEMDVVKETLDYTFEVIGDCINTDIRKTYHVITYAENSIEYYNKFSNVPDYSEEASCYMVDAHDFILDELKKNQYMAYRNKKYLYKLKSNIERIHSKINESRKTLETT